MPFEFIKQSIPDIILIKPKVFLDERGFFLESYKKSDFLRNGIQESFVQDNFSKSSKNVLRGLHFQKEPFAQAKLITVVKGSIFDVAVDIRKESPSYGKYVSVELSAENKNSLFIPVGFAHGFLSLEDDTEVAYKTSNEYNHESEEGIIWNDEFINIAWPIDNPIINPIINERDKKWLSIKDFELDFRGEK